MAVADARPHLHRRRKDDSKTDDDEVTAPFRQTMVLSDFRDMSSASNALGQRNSSLFRYGFNGFVSPVLSEAVR